jgi:signal peptide peptidase SppA
MPFDPRALWHKLPIPHFGEPPAIVPVIRLFGVIAGATLPFRGPLLNLAGLAGTIERAFSMPGAKAVALSINSPGGSPVQSALVAGRIRQMAEEKKLPVYAFVEDVAASGGYWLAVAADEIYADANSIVGSIGVISSGFGFAKLIERFGIERRLHTQGDKKSLLDSFSPEKPEDVARLARTMGDIHENFKSIVRLRRGAKLGNPEHPDLFSGEFWTGTRAKELGLIDGLGDLRSVMRGHYGDKVKFRLVGAPRGWLRRRFGFGDAAKSLPWTEDVLAAIEARLMWSRFGL